MIDWQMRIFAIIGILGILLSMFTYQIDGEEVFSINGQILFDTDEKKANITAERSEMLHFYGTVSVQGSFPNLAVVELNVSVQGLNCSISPSTLYFTSPGGSYGLLFSVAVKVPAKTSSDKEYTVTVAGTASTEPDSGQTFILDPAEATIIVKQYFNLTFDPPELNCSLEQGQRHDLGVVVTNNGNGPELVNLFLKVGDSLELEDKGIYFVFQEDPVNIPVGGNASFIFSVHADNMAETGRIETKILIFSKTADEKGYVGGPGSVPTVLNVEKNDDVFRFYREYWVLIVIILFIMVILFCLLLNKIRKRR